MNLEYLSTSFSEQFLSIMLIHLFAVISPGPDFAIVTRQCFVYGRKYALMTSFGISIGIIVHMIYCIVGVGYFLSNNEYLFNVFKIIGVFESITKPNNDKKNNVAFGLKTFVIKPNLNDLLNES